MKIIFTSLLLLVTSIGYAQWTNNYSENTIVSNSVTSIISSIGTKDGKTYVIYWDETAGANQFILKVQLLDSSGNRMFGNDGMVLNNTAPMGTFVLNYDLAVDPQNNLLVVFTETGAAQRKAYLHKISPQGVQLFGNTGIVIGDEGYSPKIKVVEDGGFVVAWIDRFMKYNNDGTKAWVNPIIIPTPVPGSETITVGEINVLPDKSIVVIFHVASVGMYSNLWAQRYNINGQAIWSLPIQISNKPTSSNTRYSVDQENDVIYLGYFSADPVLIRFDSYLQRINPDGTLPWGVNGIDFAIGDQFNEGPGSIVLDSSSGFVWSFLTKANSNQSEFGLAVQKFNKDTGARQLSDNAKDVFPLATHSKALEGKVQLLNGRPVLLFRDAYDTGIDPVKFGISYLDTAGNFIWQQQYQQIATSTTYKTAGSITEIVNDQCVVTWTENRGNGARAYAQSFKVEDVLDIDDIDIKEFSIYPNPVKDALNISSKEEIKSASFFNLSGQKVLEDKKIINNQINVSSLTEGVYIAHFYFKNAATKTVKIVKNK